MTSLLSLYFFKIFSRMVKTVECLKSLLYAYFIKFYQPRNSLCINSITTACLFLNQLRALKYTGDWQIHRYDDRHQEGEKLSWNILPQTILIEIGLTVIILRRIKMLFWKPFLTKRYVLLSTGFFANCCPRFISGNEIFVLEKK